MGRRVYSAGLRKCYVGRHKNLTPTLSLRGVPSLFEASRIICHTKTAWGSWYGSLPHRISHLTALAMASAAIKVGFALDVCSPPGGSPAATKLTVTPREESNDTLFKGASPWDGPTGMSQPERTVLECLQSDDHVLGGKTAAAEVLHRGRVVTCETVVTLAQQLGWTRRCDAWFR